MRFIRNLPGFSHRLSGAKSTGQGTQNFTILLPKGADDFLIKPFCLKEPVARIEAQRKTGKDR